MLRWGAQAAGSSLPEKPPAGLGGVGWTPLGPPERRPLFVYGEVHDRFARVMIECEDGSEVDALLVNCSEKLGFNMYVGLTQEEPLKVVATATTGERVTGDLRPPSART